MKNTTEDGASSSSHVVWGNVTQSSSSSDTKKSEDEDVEDAVEALVWGGEPKEMRKKIREKKKKKKKKDLNHLSDVLFRDESDSGSQSTGSSILQERDDRRDDKKIQEERYEALRYFTKEQLAEVIPLDEKGNLSSIGSLQHVEGEGPCVPCTFFIRQKGCKSSHWCKFCHFDHGIEVKPRRSRPSKGERLRFQKCLSRVKQGMESSGDIGNFDVTAIDEHLLPSIQNNPGKKEKFIKQLRTQVQIGQSSESQSKLSL